MQVVKKLRPELDAQRNITVIKTAALPEAKDQHRKIALPTMEGIYFERVDDVICLEAKGNYTMLHFIGKRKLLVCKTLRDMESQIRNGSQFVRIHRSNTINLNHLQKYVKGKGGYVVMENNAMINVSTGKKQAFMIALSKYFG